MDPVSLTTLVTATAASGALKSFLEKVRREVSEDVEERQSAQHADDEPEATPPATA